MEFDIGFYDIEKGNPPLMNYSDNSFNHNIGDKITIKGIKYKIVDIEHDISEIEEKISDVNGEFTELVPYDLVSVSLSRIRSVFSVISLINKNKN